ncbi:MAG: hypothetical protein AAGJ78_15195, partial [Pseudomonadota bacterium]
MIVWPFSLISSNLAQKGTIQRKILRKTLYSFSEFAMMRSALEQCVGKTLCQACSYWEQENTLEGFPSGQRDQTVNLLALPSMVRI